jgi:hypothetical protein
MLMPVGICLRTAHWFGVTASRPQLWHRPAAARSPFRYDSSVYQGQPHSGFFGAGNRAGGTVGFSAGFNKPGEDDDGVDRASSSLT